MMSPRTLVLTSIAAFLLARASTAQAALYDDLGGKPGIERLVEVALPLYMRDPRLGPYR